MSSSPEKKQRRARELVEWLKGCGCVTQFLDATKYDLSEAELGELALRIERAGPDDLERIAELLGET